MLIAKPQPFLPYWGSSSLMEDSQWQYWDKHKYIEFAICNVFSSQFTWLSSPNLSSLTTFPLLSLFTVMLSCPLRVKETTWTWSRLTTLSMCPCWRWAMPPSTQTSRGPTTTTHPHRKAQAVHTATPPLLTSSSELLACTWLALVLCLSHSWFKGTPLLEFRTGTGL